LHFGQDDFDYEASHFDTKTVNCVIYNFIVVTKLMKESCTLQRSNHRKIMLNATISILDLYEMLLCDENCSAGHNGNNLLKRIIWVSTNIFLKNFCTSKNDALLNKTNTDKNDMSKKRKLSTLKSCETVNVSVSKNDNVSKKKSN